MKLTRTWLATLYILAGTRLLAGVNFNSPRAFEAGYTAGLVAADFDGDGNVDLAVSGGGSNNVAILMGKGNGVFAHAVYYAAGDDPVSIVAADFNGDGKLDLAVADWRGHSLSVLLGNGDGTFQPQIVSFPNVKMECLVAADFNGDGKADLAACLPVSGILAVYLSNGDGTFTQSGSYDSHGPVGAAAADFNGDGKLDLAVVDQKGLTILSGNGDGTFKNPTNYSGGYSSIAVADFNGDGRPDLVLTAYQEITVSLNDGHGGFQPPLHFPENAAIYVTVGDFNGDGKPDLAVALGAPPYDSESILLGNGDGTFQQQGNYVLGAFSAAPVAADFNRDGSMDLAVPDQNAVEILLGNGAGGLQHPTNYSVAAAPRAMASGDLDGDGKEDLVIATTATPALTVLLANGVRHTYALPLEVFSVVVADFNHDGKLDIAAGFLIYLGNGDGTFRLANNYGSASSLVAADFNRDGNVDLLGLYAANTYILLGNGDGSFQRPITLAGNIWTISLISGDFNGDGKPDYALLSSDFGSFGTSTIAVMLGNGDGTFRTGPIANFGADSYLTTAGVGDFNGDGKLDLAVPLWGSHIVQILPGNGDGSFGTPVSYAVGPEPTVAVVADFDGDGKQDVAVVSYFASTVSILLGNGDGTFTTQQRSFATGILPPVSVPSSVSPQAMALVDFNGDGKPDLAVTNFPLNSVVVLTNTTP